MPSPKPNLAFELCLLVLLATFWAASYTFIKIGVATIPPITFIAARTLIGGLILVALLALRGLRLPTDMRVWGRFLVQACLNSAVPFTLIAWAEQSIDAGLAVILNAMTPVFTFVATAMITRHEQVTVRTAIGIGLSVAGVALIVGLGALSGLGREVAAQAAVIVATLCYAGAAIFGQNFRGLDPMMPAAGSLLCGAAILIPLALAVDHPWTLQPSLASLEAVFGLATLSTALPFVLFFRLMQTLGSVRTTTQSFLRVPIGVGIGMAVLGEVPGWTSWVGLACIMAGVATITLRAPARPPAIRA